MLRHEETKDVKRRKKVASPKVSPPEIIMISGRRSIGKAGF